MPVLWKRPDILADYQDKINYSEFRALADQRRAALERPHWEPLHAILKGLPLGSELRERGAVLDINVSSPAVTVGSSCELSPSEEQLLQQAIELLIPWRKGPFRLFGREVDAEWRSDRKWQRLVPFIDDLEGKRVVDIGCNNGYYMFRASLGKPALLLGVDPSEKFFYAFELLQRFIQNPCLQYEMLGIEHMTFFRNFFDTVFCFGIVYHHRNPLELLQGVRAAMRPGGQLILESQTVPGEGPWAFSPPGRYAKARNVYFLPTADCLAAWAQKSGFEQVEIVSDMALDCEEQRRTAFMPFESLSQFLSPEDPSRTIEGYPAPRRAAVVCRAP